MLSLFLGIRNRRGGIKAREAGYRGTGFGGGGKSMGRDTRVQDRSYRPVQVVGRREVDEEEVEALDDGVIC